MQQVSLSSLKIFHLFHTLQQKFYLLLKKFLPVFSPPSSGKKEKIVIWTKKPQLLPIPKLEEEGDKRITPYAFKELLKKDLFTGKIFAFQVVHGRWYCKKCLSPLIPKEITHPIRGYKAEPKVCTKVTRTVAACTPACKRLTNYQGTPITFDGVPAENHKRILDEIIQLSRDYAHRIIT